MKYQNDIVSTIKELRSLFIIIMMVGLFLIELELFAAEKFRLQLEYEQKQAAQIVFSGHSTIEPQKSLPE